MGSVLVVGVLGSRYSVLIKPDLLLTGSSQGSSSELASGEP